MFDIKTPHKEDNIEISVKKKQYKKTTTVIIDSIEPKNGHITFEINYEKKTISVAKFKVPKTVNFLTWKQECAVKEIERNNNCYYFSALNHPNLIKRVLKIRNIDISDYEFITDIHNAGTHLNIDIFETKSIDYV